MSEVVHEASPVRRNANIAVEVDGSQNRNEKSARDIAEAENNSSNNNSTPKSKGSRDAEHTTPKTTPTQHNVESPESGTEEHEVGEVAKKRRKRRKVNHACVYCRRSHMTCDQDRPCSRCIKRNIGHLCHDEPRETKKPRQESDAQQSALNSVQEDTCDNDLDSREERQNANHNDVQQTLDTFPPTFSANPADLTPGVVGNSVEGQHFENSNQQLSYNEWGLDTQSQFPNYMFNTSEVSNEYHLLSDFLSTSLLDDGAFYQQGVDPQNMFSDSSLANIMGSLPGPISSSYAANVQPSLPSLQAQASSSTVPNRPAKKSPLDKAQERYYMTAADPAGTDAPEERMNKLFKAKYEAGLLKPFNYVKGYARLNQYMERNVQASSRQRVLRQIDRFRPKFRERIQNLTDMELVMVEMWFERKLMEYDRVFASMAIPACCWRRTGEIFRGNREMAELIHVPLEQLRDGKLAIHELFVEDSLVSYWEKFGAIAFETSQKAILTSCTLKSPGSNEHPDLRCCFSFTIQRDTHSIPSLIIGNFLAIRTGKK